MNIYTQACGLFITLLLIYFYYKQPTLGLKSEICFRHLLYVVFVSVILDITSCLVIANSSHFTVFQVNTVAKLYLASLSFIAYFALFYTFVDVYEKLPEKNPKLLKLLMKIVFGLIFFLIMYTPVHIYYDEVYLYTYGPSVYITYFSALSYILLILFEVFHHKQYIKSERRKAIITWMLLWIIAAIIQFFFPKLLIVAFASCAGLLIIFFEIENPEASISRRTGHFSSAVIREYLDYLYANKRHFSLMMISFSTIADSSNDTIMLEKTIRALSKFLFTLDNCKIFDTAEGYFLLQFDSPDFIESTKFKIKNYFQSIEDSDDVAVAITLLHPFYTIVPNSQIASNSDEMLSLLAGLIPSEHKIFDSDEIILDDSTMENLREKRRIEDLVVEAIETNRVEVFFQPIYCVEKEKFISAEALVRIRLQDSTILTPDVFIPIVEETGRIIPLSDAIFRQALSFMKLFHIERLGLEFIELNLSVRQAESPIFYNRFMELLNEYDIRPEQVNFEITETSSFKSRENILNNLNKLTKEGLSFSLDDFGSGSSNLNYMIDMPVSMVKLDKTLTQAYDSNEKARAIVEAVIEMAHSINIKIIAEGVETQQAFDTMKMLGVDYIQGYYFSLPLPEREFLSFIQRNNLYPL